VWRPLLKTVTKKNKNCVLFETGSVSEQGRFGSNIRSLLSGTTYLQNPVEHTYGHAGARDISAQMCTETVRSGCRLLTHDAGNTSSFKPFRWMLLRRVPWTEVLHYCTSKSSDEVEPDQDFVWHVVVHELARSRAGKSRVVTNYFRSNISMVYDSLSDAFQMFEDDDPQMIQAAISDESIVMLLRLYFETGDTQNPKFFHTMARISLWPEGTLLHHCCEQGFFKCVEYLLKHHSPQTAPREAPWLQLADPCWMEGSWKNSAFHSTAWTGQADVMAVLVKWATDHDQYSKVRYLFDKKKQTPMDVAEMRLKKIEARGLDAACFKASFNVLAPVFGKKPFKDIACTSVLNQTVVHSEMIITDGEDHRRAFELPKGALTLRALTEVLTQEREELLSKRIDTLLLSRVDVAPSESKATEEKAAEQFMSLARLCRRVAFVNCTATPQTAICICRSVSSQLRLIPHGCDVAWESIAFPSWSEVPPRGSQEFAEAILDLSAAVRETCALHALQSIQLAPGAVAGCLPSSQRHLAQVLAAALVLKPTARRLLGHGPDDWQETDIWKRVGSSSDKFTCTNPLLRGPDTLERRLLNRGALAVSEDVCDCLDPGWRIYIEALADCLITTSLTMDQWAPLVAGRPVQQGERGLRIMRDMVDEALLFTLKMRRSRRRFGGLPGLASLVAPYLRGRENLEAYFPKALTYFRHKFRSQAMGL